MSPADVLPHLLRSDPTRPRLTVYDDTPGPIRGERVELSATVLANWVSKAANALQDEFDAAPEVRVRLALPPHWRLAYWALAVWSVGAVVVLGDGPAEVVVSDDPAALDDEDARGVLVSLPALARAATVPVPEDTMDEARELAAYGDAFSPWDEPDPTDTALDTGGAHTAYGDLVEESTGGPQRAHTATTDPEVFLGLVLRTWATGGSVVLSRGETDAETLRRRLVAEGVTLDLTGR